MKSILLVQPWIYDFAAYDYWIKPIGLLFIGSWLKKNGYDVHLIDCLNPFHSGLKKTERLKLAGRKATGYGKYPKEEIEKPLQLAGMTMRYHRYGITPSLFRSCLHDYAEPVAVMVTSMMTYWYPGVQDVIKIVKEEFPRTPVILGGNYATLCPEHAARSGADYVIEGRDVSEQTIAAIKDIRPDDFQWMPDFSNFETQDYPAYELLPYHDQLPIMTSRGCPFKCSYCASHILNKRFQARDPIRVVDEITFWHQRFNVSHFSFYDDALLYRPEKMAVPMLKEIIRRGLTCSFHCPNGLHLRYVDEEVSRLMFQAGFKTIRFGFETSDERLQLNTGGKVGNNHLREAVFHLKEAGYKKEEIGIYLLCGLPGQTYDEVLESILFVKSCGAKPIIAEYSPIPGTELWNAAVEVSPYPIEDEPLFHNNSLLPCRGERLTYDMYRQLKSIARKD